ncbi:MAG: type II toxin-antitoxin system HicA family toxin [Aureispira sp.]
MGANQTVKTKDFRKVIKHWGLTLRHTRGSHESWVKKGMSRPVIIQTNKRELPEFIFKNNLKTIGKTVKEFFETLNDL